MAKDTVIDFLRERKKTAEAHADERAAWEGALRDLSKRGLAGTADKRGAALKKNRDPRQIRYWANTTTLA